MKKVLLCGHTGSANRGCEAILRSTAMILESVGAEKPEAMTFDLAQDKGVCLDDALRLIPYPGRTLPVRTLAFLRRKLLRDDLWGAHYVAGKMLDGVSSDTVLFNVGGDTYCGRRPINSYALNTMAEQRGMSTVFWGCSVDEAVLHDREMQEDINRYSAIFVRESLSYELLQQVVQDRSRLKLVCDPAFHLPKRETALPVGFQWGNTVGINVSPYVLRRETDMNDMTYRNVFDLIDRILKTTDFSVCLIPHVYHVEPPAQDFSVLSRIYARYAANGRVSLVDRELSCMELKYIISGCRFFIGARTHSVIAAYSSGVPALAISYSIKSRGLARDVLGTEEGFAVRWQELTRESMLTELFESVLLAREEEIRRRYAAILPDYRQTILTETKTELE